MSKLFHCFWFFCEVISLVYFQFLYRNFYSVLSRLPWPSVLFTVVHSKVLSVIWWFSVRATIPSNIRHIPRQNILFQEYHLKTSSLQVKFSMHHVDEYYKINHMRHLSHGCFGPINGPDPYRSVRGPDQDRRTVRVSMPFLRVISSLLMLDDW